MEVLIFFIFVALMIWALVSTDNKRKKEEQDKKEKIESFYASEFNHALDLIKNGYYEGQILFAITRIEQVVTEWVEQYSGGQALEMQKLLPEIKKAGHAKALQMVVDKILDKSNLAKTASTKQRYIKEAVIKLTEQLDNPSLNKKELLDNIKYLRVEAARVEIEEYIEKAKRTEFKGNNKRALELYTDALYSALNDDVDDADQQETIEHLNKKIDQLKNVINTESAKTNAKS